MLRKTPTGKSPDTGGKEDESTYDSIRVCSAGRMSSVACADYRNPAPPPGGEMNPRHAIRRDYVECFDPVGGEGLRFIADTT
jgi:hypothetical protein